MDPSLLLKFLSSVFLCGLHFYVFFISSPCNCMNKFPCGSVKYEVKNGACVGLIVVFVIDYNHFLQNQLQTP
uniref:Uncharacterized protein n=1 Tax=Rhizophora mucronata TaxID=61149 RepID=A0A2P2JBY5_RHIMU